VGNKYGLLNPHLQAGCDLRQELVEHQLLVAGVLGLSQELSDLFLRLVFQLELLHDSVGLVELLLVEQLCLANNLDQTSNIAKQQGVEQRREEESQRDIDQFHL